jgi:hypothetical protein
MTTHVWIKPVCWTAFGLTVACALCYFSPDARDVIGGAALNLFQVVTTPFIFEALIAIVGVVTVLTLSQLRQEREKDEWVYLAQTKPDADGDTPPHRLDAVVMQEKPQPFNEMTTQMEVIEGYLDLGLARDALHEIESLPEHQRETPQLAQLRERAMRLICGEEAN